MIIALHGDHQFGKLIHKKVSRFDAVERAVNRDFIVMLGAQAGALPAI